jgi:hypothetical protein
MQVVTESGDVGVGTPWPSVRLDVMGGVQGTSAYSSASDRRLKRNILSLSHSPRRSSPVSDERAADLLSSSLSRTQQDPPSSSSSSSSATTTPKSHTTTPTAEESAGSGDAGGSGGGGDVQQHPNLEVVRKLRGVRYKWRREEFPQKNFPAGWQLGFIAQEVEQIVPEVVNTAASASSSTGEGFKSVQYGALVPVVVEALKEADARAQDAEHALRNRVVELEAANAKLMLRLAQLEHIVADLSSLRHTSNSGESS